MRGDFFAKQSVAAHNLRAVPFGSGAFVGWGILGHDDHGVDAQQPRRQGDPLCMVAAGVGDDACGLLLRGQTADGVVSATELEGPHTLEVLTLEVDPWGIRRASGSQTFIERT